jgi:hypothetical protein
MPRPKASNITHPSAVAFEVTHRVNGCPKTQKSIASEMGMLDCGGNIITMWKSGRTKLPLNRIEGLARATDTDAGTLFLAALREYHPDVLPALNHAFKTLDNKEVIV